MLLFLLLLMILMLLMLMHLLVGYSSTFASALVDADGADGLGGSAICEGDQLNNSL